MESTDGGDSDLPLVDVEASAPPSPPGVASARPMGLPPRRNGNPWTEQRQPPPRLCSLRELP
eukprot:11588385-Alexandrium_andersonii.AAC.1